MLAAELNGELVDDGVEADDELAALSLYRLGETVGEVRDRHGGPGLKVLHHGAKSTPRPGGPGKSEGPLPRPLVDPRRRRARVLD
jgi:hypothetical protein